MVNAIAALLRMTLLSGALHTYLHQVGVQLASAAVDDEIAVGRLQGPPQLKYSSEKFKPPPGYKDADDYCKRALEPLTQAETSRIYSESVATFDGTRPTGYTTG